MSPTKSPWATALALTLVCACAARCDERFLLTLKGTDPSPDQTPVIATIPNSTPVGVYETSPASGEPSRAIQVFDEGGERRIALSTAKLRPGHAYPITLRPVDASGENARRGVHFRPSSKNLIVTLDGEPFTEYRVDVGNKPFLDPVIGPGGVSYTRAFPMRKVNGEDHDHPHQRSFWFTHGEVDGVDFWAETPKSGVIRELDRQIVAAGPVLGRLITHNEWIAPGGRVVCADTRTWTFLSTNETRIIDLDVTIKATSGPVVFGDTKEGSFGLRVASSMDVNRKKGGKITNAEGLVDDQAWGKPSPWVDYTGPIGDQSAGIAILNHPTSFRYPTTWHVRTYGLFAANPFGYHDFGRSERGDYTLPKGESITFRHRVILHAGPTEPKTLAREFAAYAHPPQVVVETR